MAFSSLSADIHLFWWEPDNGSLNFGDTLSMVLVERIGEIKIKKALPNEGKLLGIGSIIHFAIDGDCVWGSGINGKHLDNKDYHFKNLDVRCVRGPLTRSFLMSLGINVPEIYGDPALLLPFYFPEFKKSPKRAYIIIPHISEMELFGSSEYVVHPTEPWEEIIQKIIESKFVISSSLHGIIVAEAFGIPARLLRVTENEPLFKFTDYYMGTGREKFEYACSIYEALRMGGESPPVFSAQKLIDSFPRELFKVEL
ncbi:MAG: polysaccharide pyruvyl transferase family protein [Verrucomicrobia bacterium]|nr:polysaccharide pyruvyl transferase family protein [Verrucomicrobiota bacterium]